MYNLIENSSNYSETTGSLWFYSNDEATNFNADIANDDNFKSFEYKAKLLGNLVAKATPIQGNVILKNAIIAEPLKYLSKFLRLLEMQLINCKIELKLKWTKYCVLSAASNDYTNVYSNIICTICTIKDTNCSSCNFICKKQSKTINTSKQRI